MPRGNLKLLAVLVLSGFAAGWGGCSPAAEHEDPGSPGEEAEASAGGHQQAASLLRNGALPLEGLLTGGQPTPDQLAMIRDSGYRTIVNLRDAGEAGTTRREDVEKLGMAYVELPIAGADAVNEENARKLAAVLSEARTPVVVHCGSGNRVGALLALKAFYVDRWEADKALGLGLAAGLTSLEPVVRQKLGLAAPEP